MFIQACDPTAMLPEIDLIEENLYLGNEHASMSFKHLEERKITHIVVCGYLLRMIFPKKFKYIHLKVQDDEDEDLFQYF